jgi:uncharacterized protein with von Willebrand factor type A (vWA) domain
MLVLGDHARRAAAAEAREGGDSERALAKHMKEIEPALEDLRRRLTKCKSPPKNTDPKIERGSSTKLDKPGASEQSLIDMLDDL